MVYFPVRQFPRLFNKHGKFAHLVCSLASVLCHFAHLFSKVNTLLCWTAHPLFFLACSIKQKNLLMKCAPGHTLSVLKPTSIVFNCRRVVTVPPPLASKSWKVTYLKGKTFWKLMQIKIICKILINDFFF